MSAPLRTGAALARQRLAGVAFLVVIALLLALAIALYQKRFADVVEVELATDSIGNQLTVNGDVKVRGLIVGRIADVESKGDGAMIRLDIDRSKASLIPSDAVGQLVPKTLFGEKYVSLIPVAGDARPVRKGDVLEQDRSVRAIETARVLDDLLPLLKSLDPVDVNRTLSALSGALRDRGNAIGDNLVRTRDYLRQINPELPTIQQDFIGLADFADNTDEALPDLLATLDNLSFSSRSLQQQEGQFARFLTTSTTFSGSLDSLLRQNETRLVRLAADSVTPLQLFAKYSPITSCFLKGLVDADPVVGRTFGGLQPGLHITLEVTRDQGGYLPTEKPIYKETRASCFGLDPRFTGPGNFPVYAEGEDGYNDALEKSTPGVQTGRLPPGNAPNNETGKPPTGEFTVQAQSAEAAKVLSGPVLQTSPQDVPDLAALMFAPLTNGTTVGYADGS